MRQTSASPRRQVTRGMELLARSGYAARGVVYLIIGYFAFTAAFSGGGETIGTRGALLELLENPFGTTLLWIMVVGMGAYIAWRLVQAIADPEGHGSSAKGLLIRAGLIGGAIAYGALVLFTLGLLGASPGGSGNGSNGGGDFLSSLLGWQYSNYLVYLIALVPLGVGIAHLIKGWKAKFEKYLKAPPQTMRWVRPVSRVGLIARGVAFFIVAGLLFAGGARYKATEPPGLEEALEALQNLPYGMLWLSLIGLGLIAFAVYSFAEARWRRIDVAAVLR